MLLQAWNAAVWTPEPKFRQEPQLEVSAVMICAACGHENTVRHSGELTPSEATDNNWQHGMSRRTYMINFAIDRIADQHSCEYCGALSTLPHKQAEALKKAANGGVTAAWVRRCVERLGCTVGKKMIRVQLGMDDGEEEVPAYTAPKANQRIRRFSQSRSIEKSAVA